MAKQYLSNKAFLAEIYKSREQDELTREAINMFVLLANRVIKKLHYPCEQDKEDALSEAYYDFCNNWRKFNPDFARYNGYDKLKKGDEIKVVPNLDTGRTASAIVIEHYNDKQETKVEYIVKKNQRDIGTFTKEQVIIREPNPFSFFTSTAINGFSKGWKRIHKPNQKGLNLSLDSGFDTEGDGFHSF